MKNIFRNTTALVCAAIFAFGNISTGNTVSAENMTPAATLNNAESAFALAAFGVNDDKNAAPTVSKKTKTKVAEAKVVETGGTSYTATAYALRGKTASGAGVRRGIIAADPRVLPLGTRVQITAGAWSGNYLVADTGGAIKGRKIDIWVASNSEAMKFGRRKITVKVLGKK